MRDECNLFAHIALLDETRVTIMCFEIQNASAVEKAKESRCPQLADSGICIVRQAMRSDHHAALFGLEGQLVAEVGVRDGDQLAGTLAKAAAAQMRHAVLGDDVVDIVLARRDDGAGVRMDLILLIVPPLAVDVKAMKLLPPRDWQAPRT